MNAFTTSSWPSIAAQKIVGLAPLASRNSAIALLPVCDAASMHASQSPKPRAGRQPFDGAGSVRSLPVQIRRAQSRRGKGDAPESGQDDIHVRPFPEVENGHWQISSDGGSRPAWAPSGRELFYLDSRYRLMTASLQQKPLDFSRPSVAFQFAFPPRAGPGRLFDLSPDGQRFVAVRAIAQKDEAAQPNQLRMILNWDQELQRLAPAKR
jgi:hypothetical protein